MPDDLDRPDAVASAAAPALPCLKKDNCINGKYRPVFVAQENIRLFIAKVGEHRAGLLTLTAADCLSIREFQDQWHSFLNALKRKLPIGMWTRERQPRSGNWHAHAVVDVGWDIRSGFPFEQVKQRFYANVDPRLRELWRYLRETGESRGFGRIELLPLKHSGAACARYCAKYVGKVFASERLSGEERCRLFGVWGGVRFVRSRFSFLSSRIVQKRKQWLAEMLEAESVHDLPKILGPHWWFHFGRPLCEVMMPEDFYKVGPADNRRWDHIGTRAIARDWAAWPGGPSPDSVLRSQFNLFYDIGIRQYGRRSPEASNFAMYFVASRPRAFHSFREQLPLPLPLVVPRH